MKLNLFLNDNSIFELVVDDFHLTQSRYAKKNIDIPLKTAIDCVYDTTLEVVDKNMESFPVLLKEKKIKEESSEEIVEEEEKVVEEPVEEEKVTRSYEQISIFDDDDE